MVMQTPMLSLNLRERSTLAYRLLHLVDCGLACGLLWLLTFLYEVDWSLHYTRLLWIVFGLCFVFFHYFQMYRSWRGWKYHKEFLVILKAWASVLASVLTYFFLFKISESYSRRIEDVPWAGIEVVGFFDDKPEAAEDLKALGKPLLGHTDEVETYLKEHRLDYVYIALPLRAERKIFKLLRDCRDLGAQLYMVPDIYVFGLHHAEIQSLGDLLVLNFNPDLSWKRGFDIAFSLLALVLLAPIYLLIALAIKLDSPGPVLFRHKRITATGRKFNCLKFRTMVVDAEARLSGLLAEHPEWREEWERTYKIKNDPRVTRIGRFLRRTSLDELPQFVNVLKGDMSVVGARPIVGKELEEYYKTFDERSAGRYCSMKPGITGLWQVMKRSDTEDYRERVELDDWYVLHVSLKTDLTIILQTVVCMFTGKGAY